MLIGQFIKLNNTSRETIRYYIDEGLMTPDKLSGKYNFTEMDQSDFDNIRELREMGISIRIIKQIKDNQKNCGTKEQWNDNLEIINEELARVVNETEKLNQQKKVLDQVKSELKSLIEKA